MSASSSAQRPPALRPRCRWPDCKRAGRGGQDDGYCRQHSLWRQGQSGPEPEAPGTARPKKRSQAHLLPPPAQRAAPLEFLGANMPLDEYQDGLVETFILEGMTLKCPLCGSWNFPAEKVQSGSFRRVTLCCKGGKLAHLPALPDAPEPLRSWLQSSDGRGRHFRENIRRYNAAMSFVSFGANLEVKTGAPNNRAPPVCIVHGAVYHHSHPLHAAEPTDARFAQLYLYDAAEAARLRQQRDAVLRMDMLSELGDMLGVLQNPYALAYHRMGELTKAHVDLLLSSFQFFSLSPPRLLPFCPTFLSLPRNWTLQLLDRWFDSDSYALIYLR